MVALFINKTMVLSSILTAILCLCFALAGADLQIFEHPAKPDGSLSVMVVGDWGRRGTHNQSEVARQMGIIGEKLDIDFKQWYTVLGNHDYRGDVLAQLSPFLTKRDSRWLCIRSYIVNTEIAEFFFVDTTPFQDKYFTEAEAKDHTYDWRGVLPRKKYLSNLLQDVDLALKKSTAKWKIHNFFLYFR
ncbi:hypothetical protein F0562_034520 [Nyssa sinensis]|uniref:Calcineurin-like phosphoesterase domain-containing protein n=1 Tax=Nyssa sinensis TaxID=561372 RepID=A0A5J5AJI7_9ASTE|nr:hypothetical protein F0562_034520 [Nyssa sinensis]